MPKEKLTLREIISELIERTNANMKRLRALEGEATTLTSRINTLEQTALGQKKELSDSLANLDKKLTEESERIIKLESTIKDIIARLKRVVTTEKIRELEGLIEMYNPIKSQFVTREEVTRLIEESRKR